MNTKITRKGFLGGVLAFGAAYPIFDVAASPRRPNLLVGILSDPHTTSPANLEYFRKSLRYFRDRGIDAVAIPGDFGNVALHGELLRASDVWFDVFPNDRLPDGRKVERFFISGNHDEDGWRYPLAKYHYRNTTNAESAFAFNRQKFWEEAWHEDYAPVFAKKIKGYWFVGRNWLPGRDYSANPMPEWFKANKGLLPKDRPFFYLQHEALAGATTHPDAGKLFKGKLWDGADDGKMAAILSDFPNCIALTGHTHNSLSFDTGIWQGAFTSIDCGSTGANPFTRRGHENGHPHGKEMPMFDRRTQRQVLVMGVYDDRIVFERHCMLNDESLGEDWVVPFSTEKPYSDDGKKASAAIPEFAANDKVAVRRENGPDAKGNVHDQIVITFPSVNGAVAPFARAFDYEVISLAMKRSWLVFSPQYCLAPNRDQGPVSCRLDAAGFPKGESLVFEVRPRDSLGRAGRAIRGYL